MLNLNKLNDMLDLTLESETTESLNRWIDEQLEQMAIESGMSEDVSYNQGVVSDAFDIAVSDAFNFAA